MTGYTADVLHGKTDSLKDFALTCAKAYFRDVQELPKKVSAESSYYKKNLARAKADFAKLSAMTVKQKLAYGKRMKATFIKSQENSIAEQKVISERVTAMKAKVMAWKPKKALQPLKAFMLEQLDMTSRLDGFDKTSDSILESLHANDPMDLYQEALQMAKDDIGYFTKQLKKEEKQAEATNKWLAELYKSLPKK